MTATHSKAPLVSVWMITYNHRAYIEQALDSALAQETSFPFEIVVGDDLSTDGTRDVLRRYAERHPGVIRLLLHDTNLGMIANQNAVFAACRGEFIAMLEGDDYWTDAMKLEVQVAAMRAVPACQLSFHPCIETRRGRRMSWMGPRQRVLPVERAILGGGYFCPTASLMLRRGVVADLPSFLLDAPAGDYYLQILGARDGGALYLPRTMSAYRVNAAGSWSSSVRVFENKQQFRTRTIAALQQMDRHLGLAWHRVFLAKQSELALVLAFDYLKQGDQDAFLRHYAQAREWLQSPTPHYVAVTLLKRFPRLLAAAHRAYRASREALRHVSHHLRHARR